MIRGEPLTAIIPARGGSKGIPRKNLYRLRGVTLLERAIAFAQRSPWIDAVYVTTDDPEMQDIAQRCGAAMPSLRPEELASDGARTIDAVLHLLETVPVMQGYLLLLQVTSPLRTLEDLDLLCRRFEAHSQARGVASVVRHEEPHPHKLLTLEGDYLHPFLGTNPNVPRQTLPAVWALNGAFYLTHRQIAIEEHTLMPQPTLAYEMPPERSVNVDSPLDLLLLEALVERGIAGQESFGADGGSAG